MHKRLSGHILADGHLWRIALGVGLFGGYYMAFIGEPFSTPLAAYGFWGMTALGLFLAGVALAITALYVARTRTKEEEAVAKKAADMAS